MSACRATSPFSLPRAYLIGRPAVCCGAVLPVCPCVVSFSRFHGPNKHDLLRISSRGCHEENAPPVEFQLDDVAGYGGVHCELKYSSSSVARCQSSACHNGGLCLPSNYTSSSSSSNVTCVCLTGYTGDDCSIKVSLTVVRP